MGETPAVPAPPPAASVLQTADDSLPSVGPGAFRGLTQWDAVRAGARRDVLVTPSALGDPLLIGAEQVRELSGFRFEVGLRRRAGATLVKRLLPVGLALVSTPAPLCRRPWRLRRTVSPKSTSSSATLRTKPRRDR